MILEGASFKSVAAGEDRDNDRTDVGVVVLKLDLLDEIERDSFLPVSMTDVDDIGKQGDIYIAMGYPAKKNEKLNLAKKTFKRRPACYTANILPDAKLQKLVCIGVLTCSLPSKSGTAVTRPGETSPPPIHTE